MNLLRLEKLLKDFYQISGLEIAIIDTKYRQILSHRYAGKHFCNALRDDERSGPSLYGRAEGTGCGKRV